MILFFLTKHAFSSKIPKLNLSLTFVYLDVKWYSNFYNVNMLKLVYNLFKNTDTCLIVLYYEKLWSNA